MFCSREDIFNMASEMETELRNEIEKEYRDEINVFKELIKKLRKENFELEGKYIELLQSYEILKGQQINKQLSKEIFGSDNYEL